MMKQGYLGTYANEDRLTDAHACFQNPAYTEMAHIRPNHAAVDEADSGVMPMQKHLATVAARRTKLAGTHWQIGQYLNAFSLTASFHILPGTTTL